MFSAGSEFRSEECRVPDGATVLASPARAPVVKAVSDDHGAARVGTRLLGECDMLRLEPDADLIHVVVPIAGDVAVGAVREADRLMPGHALVLLQSACVTLTARTATSLLLIDVPRADLQANCFARWHEPRRLGRANLVLPCGDVQERFGEAILSLSAIHIFRFRDGGRARACVGDAIVEALAEELRRRDRTDCVFPVAASVQRALVRMAEAGPEPVTDEDLVRAAGVTRLTLRRAIRETTGASLGKLLADARLDWVRARLQSNQESRSLGSLAEVLGFKPITFSRAYQRRFGETPTQTRTRAFTSAR